MSEFNLIFALQKITCELSWEDKHIYIYYKQIMVYFSGDVIPQS